MPLTLGSHLATRLKTVTATHSLRLGVDGGGCSGMRYTFEPDPTQQADDLVVEKEGARLLVDPISLPWVQDAEVDWDTQVFGSSIVVRNPQAASGCGCGISFAPKE